MQISSSTENGVWIIHLNGKLDSFTAKQVEDFLLAGIAQGNTKILITAEQLEYVSSAGLRIFYLAAQRLEEQNGKLAFCGLTPHVRRVFDIVDLASDFPIFATRAEALKEL